MHALILDKFDMSPVHVAAETDRYGSSHHAGETAHGKESNYKRSAITYRKMVSKIIVYTLFFLGHIIILQLTFMYMHVYNTKKKSGTPRLPGEPLLTGARAGVGVLIVLVGVGIAGELHGARRVPRVAALVEVDGREGVEADGILGDRVGNALGVEEEGIPGEVVDVVADEMVVGVESDTSLAAEEDSLLLGLEHLSTREDTTGGDTVLDESGIVGTTVESLGDGLVAVDLVEVLEVLLDDIGTGGADDAVGGSITIVGGVDVVGGGNLLHVRSFFFFLFFYRQHRSVQEKFTHHVKVEVGPHLGELALGLVDLADIVVGAKLAKLLSTPPTEANGVLDLVLGESKSDIENTNGTGAVIVDAGAGLDGVGVGTHNQNVVVVTLDGLGNDVVVNPLLGESVDVEVDRDVALSQGGNDGLTISQGDASNRGVVGGGGTESAGDGALNVVVDEGSDRAGSLGVGSLEGKVAFASLDESDLASDFGGVVLLDTSKIADNGDLAPFNGARWGVGHDEGGDGLAIDRESGRALGVDLGEGLLEDVVVAGGLDGVVDPFDGGVVTTAAKDTGSAMGIGDALESLGIGAEACERDIGLESLRGDQRLQRGMRVTLSLALTLAFALPGTSFLAEDRQGKRQKSESRGLHLDGTLVQT